MLYFLKLAGVWTLRFLIPKAEAILKPKQTQQPPKPYRTIFVERTAKVPGSDQPDGQRKIRCDIYIAKDLIDGQQQDKAASIVVNLHGSGFVLQTMGDDAPFCQRVADGINGIVIDVDYAKAPELPFPHANLDIDAVLSWLQDHDKKDSASKQTISVSKAFEVDGKEAPLQIDASKVALTGFSSGGNLALTACVRAKQRDELNRIIAVASFYPSTNLSESPWKKPNVKPESGTSGGVLPPPLRNFFYLCYVPLDKQTGKDANYPRRSSSAISPLYANADEFPQSVTIITCSGDSLAREGRQMAEHIVAGRSHEEESTKLANFGLKADPPADVPDVERIAVQQSIEQDGVVWWEAKGQGHAWDKLTNPGSEPEKLKDEAYELVIGRLRSAFAL